MTLLQNDFVI